MINEAVILAGGLGTRLRPAVRHLPKSMAEINGRPFLDYQLGYLEEWGIEHIVISVGYKSEIIKKHFGPSFKSKEIDYAVENEPLGTGGGTKKSFESIKGDAAFILNGDTFFKVDLQQLFEFKKNKEIHVCMSLLKVDDVSRYGSVETDKDFRITGFAEKGIKKGKGYINGGVYIIDKNYFLDFDFPDKFSIEKDFFEKYYQKEQFYGMVSNSYFIDIGIPEDYERAKKEFKKLQY